LVCITSRLVVRKECIIDLYIDIAEESMSTCILSQPLLDTRTAPLYFNIAASQLVSAKTGHEDIDAHISAECRTDEVRAADVHDVIPYGNKRRDVCSLKPIDKELCRTKGRIVSLCHAEKKAEDAAKASRVQRLQGRWLYSVHAPLRSRRYDIVDDHGSRIKVKEEIHHGKEHRQWMQGNKR